VSGLGGVELEVLDCCAVDDVAEVSGVLRGRFGAWMDAVEGGRNIKLPRELPDRGRPIRGLLLLKAVRLFPLTAARSSAVCESCRGGVPARLEAALLLLGSPPAAKWGADALGITTSSRPYTLSSRVSICWFICCILAVMSRSFTASLDPLSAPLYLSKAPLSCSHWPMTFFTIAWYCRSQIARQFDTEQKDLENPPQ
jgi:hypothetical protein